MDQYTDDEYKRKIEELIYKMNPMQLGQFLISNVALDMVSFSGILFEYKQMRRYLNILFISFGKLCNVFFQDDYLARDLDLARDLARDRTRALVITINAEAILQNNLAGLSIQPGTKKQKQDYDSFLKNLRKCGADYWADWIEELFTNNLRISDVRVKELESLTEAQYELTISETSILLLDMRKKGTKYFKETRLIILGDKGSGKTSLARRIKKLNKKMPEEWESTPGVDFLPVKASEINPEYSGKQDHTINIWDFAGHTVTHAAHKFFLSDRAVYVIVIRGRMGENNTPVNEWLEQIKYYAGNTTSEKIKVYILINETDENNPTADYDPKYDENFDIETRPRKINIKKEKKPGGPLDRFRKDIVEHIVESPRNMDISSSIFDIKSEIEKEFEGISNVGKIKMGEIIKRHMPDAKIDDVLHILHSYGICFYYDELHGDGDNKIQADSIVLNPRWVTYAIYRLINYITNDQGKNPERLDGHIYEREYKDAFSDVRIPDDSYGGIAKSLYVPEDRYIFLSELAQTFDLAYKKDDLMVFPVCLPENYPKKKSGLGEQGDSDIFIEISTSRLGTTTSPATFPKDIIPAFIVKQHKNLEYLGKTAYCSRNGAVLKWAAGKSKSIMAEVKKTESTKIVVLVKDNKKESCEFCADLVRDLNDIIQKYKGFQKENERPSVKVCFRDNKRRDQSCVIEELLEEGSWIEQIVDPTQWKRLKGIGEIIKKARIKGKLEANLGPVKAGVEVEL